MEGNGGESAIFGELRKFGVDQFLVVPSRAELAGEGNADSRAHLAENGFDQRQIAEQSGTAVAFHDFINGAAEVDVDDIEASALTNLRGFGQDIRIRPEELAGDGVLFRFELKIPEVAIRLFCRLRADYSVRTGELRHEESAPTLVPDQAAEHRIGNARHRREHGGGSDTDVPDRETGRKRTMGSVFVHLWKIEESN